MSELKFYTGETFKKGDYVQITGKEGYIGGIVNSPTPEAIISYFGKHFTDMFDTMYPFNKHYGKVIHGTVYEVGKFNMYAIRTKENKMYLFTNDYHEMKAINKKEVTFPRRHLDEI